MEAIRNVARQTILKGFSLPLQLISLLPIQSWQKTLHAAEDLESYTNIAVQNFRKAYCSNSNNISVFSQTFNLVEERNIILTDKMVAEEAVTMVFAGSDTTHTTLTYLIWSVLKRPELQQLIELEVANVLDDFDIPQIEKMPTLNATIEETLRLYGPIQGPLQRVIPVEGSSYCGYYLPGGTFATAQAYTLNRDATIWPQPLLYDTITYPDIVTASNSSPDLTKLDSWNLLHLVRKKPSCHLVGVQEPA